MVSAAIYRGHFPGTRFPHADADKGKDEVFEELVLHGCRGP